MDRIAADASTPGKVSPVQALIVFMLSITGTLLLSLLMDIPIFFMISSFMFSLSFTAIIHDNWALNSASIPPIPLLILATMSDIHDAWINPASATVMGALVMHAVTVVFCMSILVSRNNTSLLVMIISSMIYPLWMVAVQEFIDPGYVVNYFGGIMPRPALFFFTLVSGIVVSIVSFCKNARVPRDEIKCDGGWCPL
jgi:hypothetical protein